MCNMEFVSCIFGAPKGVRFTCKVVKWSCMWRFGIQKTSYEQKYQRGLWNFCILIINANILAPKYMVDTHNFHTYIHKYKHRWSAHALHTNSFSFYYNFRALFAPLSVKFMWQRECSNECLRRQRTKDTHIGNK